MLQFIYIVKINDASQICIQTLARFQRNQSGFNQIEINPMLTS